MGLIQRESLLKQLSLQSNWGVNLDLINIIEDQYQWHKQKKASKVLSTKFNQVKLKKQQIKAINSLPITNQWPVIKKLSALIMRAHLNLRREMLKTYHHMSYTSIQSTNLMKMVLINVSVDMQITLNNLGKV